MALLDDVGASVTNLQSHLDALLDAVDKDAKEKIKEVAGWIQEEVNKLSTAHTRAQGGGPEGAVGESA